jgi:uncharacterized protein (PEP-CTERM system associated)
VRTGLVVAAGVAAVSPALAARWTIKPAVSVEESFSDNVGLAPDVSDRTSDFVTAVAPSLSVRGSGGRLNLNMDYTLQRLEFMRTPDRNAWHNNLAAGGTAELWQRQLFFDTNAAISRQTSSAGLPTSSSTANFGVNQTESTSWNAGPRFLHHFGSWAETESRITRSAVYTTSPSRATASASTGVTATSLQQSTSDQQSFVMNSGRQFTRVKWSTTLDATKTSYETRPHTKSQTERADLNYIINREVSLLGGLGWEKIDDETLSQPPNGAIWNFGVQFHPGPRTNFQANYNHRYSTEYASFNGTYLVSPRTTFTMGYDESIQNSSRLVSEDLRFLIVDSNGRLIDSRTGLPFNPGDSLFGVRTTTTRVKSFTAGLNGTRGRTQFNARLTHSDQLSDTTTVSDTVNDATFSLSRTLTHRLTGTVTLDYKMLSLGGQTRKDTRMLGGTSLSYKLTPDMNVVFSVNYMQTNSNIDTVDVHEKAASVVLRKTF